MNDAQGQGGPMASTAVLMVIQGPRGEEISGVRMQANDRRTQPRQLLAR